MVDGPVTTNSEFTCGTPFVVLNIHVYADEGFESQIFQVEYFSSGLILFLSALLLLLLLLFGF